MRSLASFAGERAVALADLALLPKLNANACGDFTLLAKSDWHLFHGYPEMVVHSMHLDTVFLHQMHANGMRFVDLEPPAVAFHMEHAEGSGWTPEGEAKYFASVAKKGMPRISVVELRAMKRSMLADSRKKRLVMYNGTDWGLAGAEITDLRVNGG